MICFSVYLSYEDEDFYRPIAEGCTKSQVFDILSRHLMLAEVASFKIVPTLSFTPFKEYTL